MKHIKLGTVLAMARYDSGKTQDQVAICMNVTKRTIQNWENGYTDPSVHGVLDYFEAIGRNPVPYLHIYLHPNSKTNSKNEDINIIKETLIDQISSMSELEARELYYILQGNHGSSTYAVLQEMVANLQCSILSRTIVAEIVRCNFEREEITGELVCPNDIMPDFESFTGAIQKGKHAVVTNAKGYVI